MFKNFRWQIALWFVGLSSANYVALCLVGAMYFYTSLSRSMDEELKVVASQIGHAIDLTGNKPVFRDWLRVVETEPARSIMSMQLFDDSGVLLEHYGPLGIAKLFQDETEVAANGHKLRIRHSKLIHKGKLVGYLQLQLPVDNRDDCTREFLITMIVMAPFVLSGFGLCSYIVSGIAARPIEQLVGALQRFVADAGHELNTPACIVQARAQSLERKLSKNGLIFSDLPIICAAAERMGHIVKNLMLLAELDSKHKSPVKGVINVKDIIMSVLAEFGPRFEEKQICLTPEDMDDAMVSAEQESVDCILRNLLENALRYTEPGGAVRVSCVATATTEVIINVEDTGIGIPEESLAQIFERFYRVDASRSRASGGSGLGLSIVRALTESINGTVDVTSEPGTGTRFSVKLPISKYKSATPGRSLHTTISTVK